MVKTKAGSAARGRGVGRRRRAGAGRQPAKKRVATSSGVEQVGNEEMKNGWQSSKDLGQSFGHLFRSGLWTDVTFLCKEQESSDVTHIKAHKLVLAARSPVFEAMLFGPFGENQSEVELKDIDVKVFLAFLRYIYTDETDLTAENAADVLAVAHRYQVDGLVRASANVLLTTISSENACELLQVALFYDNEELKDGVCKYIDDNADQILESDAFMKCSLDCLTFILAGNTFFAKEKKIFEKSMEWGRQKCLERNTEPNGKAIKTALGNAFLYIRIPTMPLEDFLTCSRGKGYFSMEEHETLLDQIAGISTASLACPVPRSPQEENLDFRTDCDSETNDYGFDIAGRCLRGLIALTSSVELILSRLVLDGIHVLTPVGKEMYIPGDSIREQEMSAGYYRMTNQRYKRYYFTNLAFRGRYNQKFFNKAIHVQNICITNIFSNLIPCLSGQVSCNDKSSNISFEYSNSGELICKLQEPLHIAQNISNNIEIYVDIAENTGLNLAADRADETQSVASCHGTFKASYSSNGPNIVKQIVCTRSSGRHGKNFENTETFALRN